MAVSPLDRISPPAVPPTDAPGAAAPSAPADALDAELAQSPATQPPDVDPSAPLSLRALVTSKEAGIIIGRGGQHVAELREKTGVKAGVSKVVPRAHRVLTISGSLQSVVQAFNLISQAYIDSAQQASESPAESLSPAPGADTALAPPPLGSDAEPGPDAEPREAPHIADNSITGAPGVEAASSVVDASPVSGSPSGTEAPLASNGAATIRLLISHALMGAVIGKQGVTIKAIQEKSGTRMVATKGMLPNSTERVVDITGTASAIEQALMDVGKYIVADWERAQGTVLYEPEAADGAAALAAGLPMGGSPLGYGGRGIGPRRSGKSRGTDYPAVAGMPSLPPTIPAPGFGAMAPLPGTMPGGVDLLATAAAMPYAAHVASMQHQRVFAPTGIPAGSTTSPSAVATAASQGAAVAPGGGFVAGGVTGQGPMTAPAVIDAAHMRTQNIAIPADMVGCIIGKGGSKITEIRRLSGSRISIAKVAHDTSGDRLFTIQGTPASNEKALYLLYNQVRASSRFI